MTPPSYEPSPEEIAKACREIQDGWSVEEELTRRMKGFRRVEWEVPTRSVP